MRGIMIEQITRTVSALTQIRYVAFNSHIYSFCNYLLSAYDVLRYYLRDKNWAVKKPGPYFHKTFILNEGSR